MTLESMSVGDSPCEESQEAQRGPVTRDRPAPQSCWVTTPARAPTGDGQTTDSALPYELRALFAGRLIVR
jgi:hypothetical protein